MPKSFWGEKQPFLKIGRTSFIHIDESLFNVDRRNENGKTWKTHQKCSCATLWTIIVPGDEIQSSYMKFSHIIFDLDNVEYIFVDFVYSSPQRIYFIQKFKINLLDKPRIYVADHKFDRTRCSSCRGQRIDMQYLVNRKYLKSVQSYPICLSSDARSEAGLRDMDIISSVWGESSSICEQKTVRVADIGSR